jgi:hypothetical protein
MKIRPVGAELFHADGQTDMTKLIVAFRNFVDAPESIKSEKNRYDTILLIDMSLIKSKHLNLRRLPLIKIKLLKSSSHFGILSGLP